MKLGASHESLFDISGYENVHLPTIIVADEASWGDVEAGSMDARGFLFGNYAGEIHMCVDDSEHDEAFRVVVYGSDAEVGEEVVLSSGVLEEFCMGRSDDQVWSMIVLRALRMTGRYDVKI